MKKIGIVIAMEEEFQAIENKIKEIKVHEEKGLKFFEGKIGEKECVIVKSGVGKVNAARTTQAMIDNFDIEYIINMGASGSIANDLNIGDIVIGKYVVQHDFDITAFGHNKGYITGVGEKVECDKKLIKTLEDVAKNNGKYKVKLGIVVTGDIFCTDEIMKEKIKLKPATKLKTNIVFIKEVPKGTAISYSRTYITDKKTKIATIPVGYADGIRRSLSNNGKVYINGK